MKMIQYLRFEKRVYIDIQAVRRSSMRHKMINLDPTSHEYASNMKNFSEFVRKQIDLHRKGETIEDAVRQRNFWKAKYEEEVKKNED